MPIEPGELCDTELPWEARFDEKWWRLMATGKPLADRCTRYIDLLARLEDRDRNHITRLEVGQLALLDGKLLEHMTGFDTGLGKVPRQRLADPDWRGACRKPPVRRRNRRSQAS